MCCFLLLVLVKFKEFNEWMYLFTEVLVAFQTLYNPYTEVIDITDEQGLLGRSKRRWRVEDCAESVTHSLHEYRPMTWSLFPRPRSSHYDRIHQLFICTRYACNARRAFPYDIFSLQTLVNTAESLNSLIVNSNKSHRTKKLANHGCIGRKFPP